MTNVPAITGVYCAAATPVTEDGRPDADRLAAHCHWLLDEGCHGIAVLGTTGEANSFAPDERRPLLEGVDRQARLIALAAERDPLYRDVADLALAPRPLTPAAVTAALVARATGRRQAPARASAP